MGRPAASRRSLVVLRSAATDEIIEKMKTLTVSPDPGRRGAAASREPPQPQGQGLAGCRDTRLCTASLSRNGLRYGSAGPKLHHVKRLAVAPHRLLAALRSLPLTHARRPPAAAAGGCRACEAD